MVSLLPIIYFVKNFITRSARQISVFFSVASGPNEVRAFAVILSDKVISVQRDGKDIAYVR